MLKFHWRPPQFFILWNNFLYFSSLTFSVLQPTLRAAYGYLKKHYALEKLLFTFFTSTTFIEGSFFLSLLSRTLEQNEKSKTNITKIRNYSFSLPTVTPKISRYHRYYCFRRLHHRFQQLLKNENGIIYLFSQPSFIHLRYM